MESEKILKPEQIQGGIQMRKDGRFQLFSVACPGVGPDAPECKITEKKTIGEGRD